MTHAHDPGSMTNTHDWNKNLAAVGAERWLSPGVMGLLSAALVVLAAAPAVVWAQVDIKPVRPNSGVAASAPLGASGALPATAFDELPPLDLGQGSAKPLATPAQPVRATGPSSGTALPTGVETGRRMNLGAATHARTRSASPVPAPAMAPGDGPGDGSGVERLVFDRRPLHVALPVERERLIAFTQPVALHIPEDAEHYVRLQIIGNTVYARALAAFGTVRIVAEQLDGEGLQIPLDLVADRSTAAAGPEVHIVSRNEMRNQQRTQLQAAQHSGGPGRTGEARPSAGDASEGDAVDAVALTRFAARQLYAPMRLAAQHPDIHQVPVVAEPVLGLYRGARAKLTPIGAWRAGPLWVTAVRMTNLEPRALEIHLEELRGRWITSTAHHGVLGRAGSENDTTALYLVCDQPFEACR